MSSEVTSSAQGTQKDFRSSPWEDSSWEIVGDSPRGEQFFPMPVAVVPSEQITADPMFSDFGGLSDAGTASRWHLPQHLASAQAASANKTKSDNSIKLAPAELEKVKAEAYAAGHAAGAAEIQQQEASRFGAVQSSIQTVLQDLRAQLEEAAEATVQRSVELSVAIAKKIIDGAVEVNPEYIVQLLKQALPLAGGAAIKKVRVSPQDMEFIEVVGAQKLFQEFDSSWVFEADASIRAGCVVETSAGAIDFDIDRAFDRVRDSIIRVSK